MKCSIESSSKLRYDGQAQGDWKDVGQINDRLMREVGDGKQNPNQEMEHRMGE